MKKEYILAMLLLMGFGVVSTMAFSVDSNTTGTISLFDVSPSSSAVYIDATNGAEFNAFGKKIFVAKFYLDTADTTPDAYVKVSFVDENGAVFVPAATCTITWGIDEPAQVDQTFTGDAAKTYVEFSVDSVLTTGATYIEIKLSDSAVDIVDDGDGGGAGTGPDLASAFLVINDATGIATPGSASFN